MYEAPGSSIKHIVIDNEVALGIKPALCFTRGAEASVTAALDRDDLEQNMQGGATGGNDEEPLTAEAVSV